MRFAVIYIIFRCILLLGVSSCAQPPASTCEPGDTILVVYDNRLLVPRGLNPDQISVFPHDRANYLPSQGPPSRQVDIKTIRLVCVGCTGETMVQEYWQAHKEWMETDSIYSGLRVVEVGISPYGRYALLQHQWTAEKDPARYSVEWFAPLDSEFLVVKYRIDADVFDEVGGMAELKRFAERVRLLPE